jgi:hypothetical protein
MERELKFSLSPAAYNHFRTLVPRDCSPLEQRNVDSAIRVPELWRCPAVAVLKRACHQVLSHRHRYGLQEQKNMYKRNLAAKTLNGLSSIL